MFKAYVIIIAMIFAIPVVASAVAVVWICFRMSALVGWIALAVCLVVVAGCTALVIRHVRGGAN